MKNLPAMLAASLSLALTGTPAWAATKTAAHRAEQLATTQMPHVSVIQLGAKGSPVILIPGMGTPRAVWNGIAPALAKRHRVYIVQVNGFGGDDPRANLGQQVLDGVVEDLGRFITERRLGKPAIIGHSLGGLVGMLLATRRPGLVDRLMVVDALPFYSVLAVPPGSDVTAQSIEPVAARMRAGIQATYGKPLDPAVLDAQAKGMALTPHAQGLVRGWIQSADARVTAALTYDDMTTDLRPALGTMAVPTTVVYPWHAGGYPREAVAAFYRRQFQGAPQVAFVEIADSAHFIMLDQPKVFAVQINRFLGD